MRLGVSNFAFASDLKDAGIDSPTGLVAENVVESIVLANCSETYLKNHNLSKTEKLEKVYLLAGPSFFKVADVGLKGRLQKLRNKIL